MTYSGDLRPLPSTNLPAERASDTAGERDVTRVWTRAARHELETRLESIQRLAGTSARRASDTRHESLSDVYDEAEAARRALDALDALLAFQGAPPMLASIEVSDLLIAALSRWKTRAPRHTFELALPGHEPVLLGDPSRIERALDALIAWMVASSAGGDVRVALRYATNDAPNADASEAIVSVRATLRDGIAPPRDIDDTSSADAPTAISLTLAREVAAAHGGRLWVTRGPDQRVLTLWLALPSTPPVASEQAQLETEPVEELQGVESGPSLPLARQRRVVLVAHGDSRLARYLRANLERDGYRALTAADLPSALRVIDIEEPDITLLDSTLPSASHDPLLRTLARTPSPVILLTGEASPARTVSALDAGAADVIAMPLSVEETLARVRRVLRATANTASAAHRKVITCGDLTLDEAERRVTLAGQIVPLSKTEYRLLRALARHAGKTVTHESLLEQVWGPAYHQEIEFIWVYIRRLRRKIEPDPARPRYIQTAPGVGYLLTAPAPVTA
jgi:two-component system KDP operon response regulator KdpE